MPPSLAAVPPSSSATQQAAVPHPFRSAVDRTPIHGQDLQAIFEQEDEEGPVDQQEVINHPRVREMTQRNHPFDNILGSLRKGVTTRSHLANFCQIYSFVSSLEPLKVEQALGDPDWVMAMQEELNNF